eukprot:4631765-Pleurochrysis_carterae.AAC.2
MPAETPYELRVHQRALVNLCYIRRPAPALLDDRAAGVPLYVPQSPGFSLHAAAIFFNSCSTTRASRVRRREERRRARSAVRPLGRGRCVTYAMRSASYAQRGSAPAGPPLRLRLMNMGTRLPRACASLMPTTSINAHS